MQARRVIFSSALVKKIPFNKPAAVRSIQFTQNWQAIQTNGKNTRRNSNQVTA